LRDGKARLLDDAQKHQLAAGAEPRGRPAGGLHRDWR